MKNIKFLILGLSAILALNACNNGSKTASTESKDSATAKDTTAKPAAPKDSMLGDKVSEKGGVELYYFTGSPDFPDAELKMNKPEKKEYKAGDKVGFEFALKNYELTKQTPGAKSCMCNNSMKGQHIHLILNDKPYKALYKEKFDTALEAGHYIALTFLSRSYHESVKGKNAYQLTQFNVGKKEKDEDLSKPMLFYSRPKGEYKGKDMEKVLLDFYLVNTELSENGNKVRATINGNEFMITKWTGYAMKGLKPGENTIKLELLDKDGKLIPGVYNSVERKIKLVE